MSPEVSVVICCYNSATRLPETLRHLVQQVVPAEIAWEVIVVDNASGDDTAEMARRNWPDMPPAPLRVVAEPAAGLSHARMRGIAEARYEILSFIDDDNWVADDWIAKVAKIFEEHPEIGACGGRSEAVCEGPVPEWFKGAQGHYAVGEPYPATGDITMTVGTLLWGAGLNLRAAAVRRLLDGGFHFLMTGRKGKQVTSGEDTELCLALRASGWRFWYDRDLSLKHFIPKERLNWAYALRLLRGAGMASPWFDLYLLSFNAPPYTGFPAWKKSWAFQMVRTFYWCVRWGIKNPRGIFSAREGYIPVLHWAGARAVVAALWAMRSDYSRHARTLREAAWSRRSA